MKLNGFSSGSDASDNNCFVLRLFVCQKAKISRDTSVRVRIFSGGFLHLFKTSREIESKELNFLREADG